MANACGSGVFNITVDGCTFGTDGSDFAGIHIKAPRLRGGSVHDIRIVNSNFHLDKRQQNSSVFGNTLLICCRFLSYVKWVTYSHCCMVPCHVRLCQQHGQRLGQLILT